MKSFTLTLPLPTSVNQLYIGKGKTKRLHPNAAGWKNEAGWRINEARAAGKYKPLPSNIWYWTDILLPRNHLGDSDNRLKVLHDLLHEMGATPDDKWLFGGTYMRSDDVISGTCRVTATALSQDMNKDTWRAIRWLADQMCGDPMPSAEEIELRGVVT